MKVQVNGQTQDVPDGVTLRAFLESKGINPNVVACEVNERIVKRAQLPEVTLKEGDVLEIIQMIGGG